jgi:WD40 repeat protein
LKTLISFYEILGVAQTADVESLRKAYHALARKNHPDVSVDPNAHRIMARINEAFETLIDPVKRIEYDAMLAGGGLEDAPKDGDRKRQQPVVVRLTHRLKAHKTPIYAIAFSPDGMLVSSAFDNEILWWNDDLDVPLRRRRLETGVISTLRPLPGDRLVAAGSAENSSTLWSLCGDRLEHSRTCVEEWVSCVAISVDGCTIATGSLHNALSVNCAVSGEPLYRKQEHISSVTAVTWSADGRYLATGSADASVKIWHGPTGAMLQTLRQVRSTVTALAFSPDNQFIAVASVDLSIRVFSLVDGTLVKMMFGHTKPVESIDFHPNGWLFASGSRDGSVGLWNAAKGIGNVRIEVSNRPVAAVAFSPDGERLAAGGQDRIIRIWEVAAKEPADAPRD